MAVAPAPVLPVHGAAAISADELATIDALLGHGAQGSFATFRRGTQTLQAMLDATDRRLKTLTSQYPSILPSLTTTPTWSDVVVESYCMELIAAMHEVRKQHSALVSLRQRMFMPHPGMGG